MKGLTRRFDVELVAGLGMVEGGPHVGVPIGNLASRWRGALAAATTSLVVVMTVHGVSQAVFKHYY